jgi:uncharacterized protein
MLRKITPWILLLAVVAGGPVLAAPATPTDHEIYEAAQSGHLAQAEQMVNQVLQQYPKSAKAHYVAAEVYARAGDFSTARRELNGAESLDPGLGFARPQSVAALRAELAQSRFVPRIAQQPPYATEYAPHARTRTGVSWGAVLLVISGLVILWALVRRRMQPPVYPPYPGQPMGGVGPMGGGVAPPYPYGGAPGAGPGLLGSLGTGLAVGAGVAAGEELVRHALGGPQSGGVIPPASAGEEGADPSQINPDMGGQDFGVSDPGSWDDGSGGGDEDFGVGGDDGGGGGGDWT